MAARARLTRGKLKPQPSRAKVSTGTLVRRPGAMSTPALGGIAPIVPPAPAPARIPAPAQTQTPLPPDAGYEETMAALANRRDSTITGLGAQRQQGLLQYGYTEGAPGQVAFDATNPFSQAAVLKRNYDQARTGNTTNYAARGQLYAGSLQNAQDTTNRGELQASDTVQKQLLSFLARNTQARFRAGSDYEAGAGQARADQIARAPQNPAYETVTAPPAAAPAAASPVAKAAVKPKPKPKPKKTPGRYRR